MEFYSEGDKRSTDAYPKLCQPDNTHVSSISDGRDHSIYDFLSRPVMLKNLHWSSSQIKGERLYQIHLEQIFDNAMFKKKIQNFVAIRTDFELRVQVNSMPFQAGRLLLSYVPFQKQFGKRGEYYTRDKNSNVLTSLTGCPHIDLDISSETEVTFKIPFISNQNSYCLQYPNGNTLGLFQLYVYSPLVSSDAQSIDVTIWANLCNTKLHYPTGSDVITVQSGEEKAMASDSDILSMSVGRDYKINTSIDVAQLSEDLPWSFGGLTGVHRMFGNSKPINSSVTEMMRPRYTRFMTNYDGLDDSHSMGLASTNKLSKDEGVCLTSLDEMAISNIVGVQNYFTAFDWKKEQTNETRLWMNEVHPMKTRQEGADNNYQQPTFLAYISSCFQSWRGNIKFTFKVVKTKFHSGRLRVVFQPYYDENNFSKSDGCYSKILDLRSASEFTFEVPFVSPTYFKFVPSISEIQTAIYPLDCSIGSINVYVLNDLVAPSTVSSSVEVLVEVGAGADFELAGPTFPVLAPAILPTPPPPSRSFRGAMNRLVNSTMGLEDSPIETINPDTVMSSTQTVTTTPHPPASTVMPNWGKYGFTISQDGKDYYWCKNTKNQYILLDYENDKNAQKKMRGDVVCQMGDARDVTENQTQQQQKQTIEKPINPMDHNIPLVGSIQIPARTFGEKCLSLKQLMKRYMLIEYKTDTITSGQFYTICPWKSFPPYNSFKNPFSEDGQLYFDYFDVFSHIFTFYRGGMRIKFVPLAQTGNAQVGSIISRFRLVDYRECGDYKTNINIATDKPANWQTSMSGSVCIPEQEGPGDYQIPYYANVSCVPITSKPHNKDNIKANLYPYPELRIWPKPCEDDANPSKVDYLIYRAAADDFCFMGLVGPPICVVRST